MSHQKVFIKCTIENLQQLQEQSLLGRYVHSQDENMIFRKYVLALTQVIVPSRTIEGIKDKIPLQNHYLNCFRNCKIYRLAKIIHVCTCIIAKYNTVIFVGDVPDCFIEFCHPTFSNCLHLAQRFKYSFPQQYSLLTC